MNRENIHDVPIKTWNRWSVLSKELFNAVYEDILQLGPELFFGSEFDYAPYTEYQFNIIAWNAAFIAAERRARPNERTDVRLIDELEEDWRNERVQ